jgi:serine/threonine protein phosphatase PrpC
MDRTDGQDKEQGSVLDAPASDLDNGNMPATEEAVALAMPDDPAELLDRMSAPELVEDEEAMQNAGDGLEAGLAGVEPFDPNATTAEGDTPAMQGALVEDLPSVEGEATETEIGETAITQEEMAATASDETTDQAATEPDEELSPLAVNAMVAGKYVVQHQLHHSPDRNLYRVAAVEQQACETCGRLSPAGTTECGYCGATLGGQAPAEFYLMAEAFYPEALIQDPDLIALNLYHPSLVPVIDFFDYKPFERTRHFAVAEPRQGVRLSQMSMPRPPTQVLNWAMQLSDALDYLHNRGVVGAGAEADDILVQGDRASLASLQNASASAASDTERIDQQSMDLARLAGTIYEAYTGSPPSVSPEGMLPTPAGAPEQIGAAFRAAIEPVQGAARPISAAQWRDLLASALDAMAEMERPGRPVSFASASLTDVGRLREQNQDSFGVAEFFQESEERPFGVGLYVIADGMGGHKGGEFASALSVQAFSGEIIGRVIAPLVSVTGERPALNNEAILQAMTKALQLANDRIYKSRTNRQNDMGTTCVAAVVAGGKAYIVNIGDSRIYLFGKEQEETQSSSSDATQPLALGTSPLDSTLYLRGMSQAQPEDSTGGQDANQHIDRSSGYKLAQVSVDHSLVHRLVELGQLDPEDAKTHPHRNFIYRSLGGPPPVEVDTFIRTLRPGDRLLLCSDGLNSMIEDDEIEAVLASEDDPKAACRRLIDLANNAGGHDNITTILIDVLDYLPYSEPL